MTSAAWCCTTDFASASTGCGVGDLAVGLPAGIAQALEAVLERGAARFDDLLADRIEVEVGEQDRRGTERLVRGDGAQRRLDPGCGIIDGQNHPVTGRLGTLVAQTDDLGGVGRVHLALDQNHDVVHGTPPVR